MKKNVTLLLSLFLTTNLINSRSHELENKISYDDKTLSEMYKELHPRLDDKTIERHLKSLKQDKNELNEFLQEYQFTKKTSR